MITMLILALAKIITVLGIGALLGMIGYVAYISFKFVLNKIRNFLQKKVGGKAVILSVSSLVEEIAKEKKNMKDTTTLDELEKELKGEGVIIANINENGKIESTDDIEIIKTDEMEDKLKQKLEEKNGVMIVTN